jgi:hypothetical protein
VHYLAETKVGTNDLFPCDPEEFPLQEAIVVSQPIPQLGLVMIPQPLGTRGEPESIKAKRLTFPIGRPDTTTPALAALLPV